MNEEEVLKAIDHAIGKCMTERDDYKKHIEQLGHENDILLEVVNSVRKAVNQRGDVVIAQDVCTIMYDHDHRNSTE